MFTYCGGGGGVKKKSMYGCIKCGREFHANYYTAFYFQGAMKADAKTLMDMILSTERSLRKGLNKRSKYV